MHLSRNFFEKPSASLHLLCRKDNTPARAFLLAHNDIPFCHIIKVLVMWSSELPPSIASDPQNLEKRLRNGANSFRAAGKADTGRKR